MHRKFLLCLAFVGIALAACRNGIRNGRVESAFGEQCDPSPGPVLAGDCCDEQCMYRPSTYTCSAESLCFNEAKCTGSSSSCPVNYDNTDVCTAAGDCNDAVYCNNGACADPTPYANTHKCYTGDSTECTVDTYCDGDNIGDCPAPYAPSTLKCADSSDVCEQDSYCPGVSAPESEQYACPAKEPVTAESNTECSAASDSTCEAASYCDGTRRDCPAALPADNTVQCADNSENVAMCHGALSHCEGGASFACVPDPAESTVMCDGSTKDDSACVGESYCSGTDYTCVASDAAATVVCNSASQDPTTCSGQSYCSGDSSRTCTIAPAASTVKCADGDECNYDVHCDGENTGCPAADSYPDDQTDCSSKCTEAGTTAKCNGAGSCGSCEHAGEIADPLITGFHHQKFWFEGEAGSYYNFFSQPGVQVNTLIAKATENKKLTVVGSIGFVTANNKVSFNAVSGPKGVFAINGKNVTFTEKNNMLDINDCVQMAWSSKSVLFSSAEFEIVFAFKAANPAEGLTIPYINTKFAHVSGDVKKMSGIIGFTATDAKAKQSAADAKVSDIFAIDAKATTFTGATLACEQGAKTRSDNKMGAASKHQLDDLKKFSWAWA